MAPACRAQVIAIAASDPLAKELNDINDVETKLPGVISGIREWFRWYKTPDGKPINAFGFGEKALNKAETLKVGGVQDMTTSISQAPVIASVELTMPCCCVMYV